MAIMAEKAFERAGNIVEVTPTRRSGGDRKRRRDRRLPGRSTRPWKWNSGIGTLGNTGKGGRRGNPGQARSTNRGQRTNQGPLQRPPPKSYPRRARYQRGYGKSGGNTPDRGAVWLRARGLRANFTLPGRSAEFATKPAGREKLGGVHPGQVACLRATHRQIEDGFVDQLPEAGTLGRGPRAIPWSQPRGTPGGPGCGR